MNEPQPTVRPSWIIGLAVACSYLSLLAAGIGALFLGSSPGWIFVTFGVCLAASRGYRLERNRQ